MKSLTSEREGWRREVVVEVDGGEQGRNEFVGRVTEN